MYPWLKCERVHTDLDNIVELRHYVFPSVTQVSRNNGIAHVNRITKDNGDFVHYAVVLVGEGGVGVSVMWSMGSI